MRLAKHSGAIFIFFYILCASTFSYANDQKINVCEQVSDEKLAAIYPGKFFSTYQEGGCQWSIKPGGNAYFQIGILNSQKNLRDFFQSEVPTKFELKRINDLGERGLMTVSHGFLDVIVLREGNWVLISTVNLLRIKDGDERQRALWDIYRRILQALD